MNSQMIPAGRRQPLQNTKRDGRLPAGNIHSDAALSNPGLAPNAPTPFHASLLITVALVVASFAAPAAAATITGHVRFEGAAPARPTMHMSADPACDKVAPEGRPSELVIVDAAGGLANVIVYVKSGLSEKLRYPAPAQPARIDQTGCIYIPHVIGVRAGQEIEIHSDDPTLHNVNARTAVNTPFNEAMPGAGSVLRKSFVNPEVAVKLKCDIHPWMVAYVGVFDHPFFVVSSADGSFTLPALPEGEYTIEAWHESLGRKSAAVEVDEEDTAKVDFSFAGN